MGDRLSAERACKDPNPIIDGRKANVNLAILGAKPRGNLTQGKTRLLNNSSDSFIVQYLIEERKLLLLFKLTRSSSLFLFAPS